MAKRDFSNVMNEQLAARPSGWERFVFEINNERKRLATLGATELAHALFGGSAFTLYGDGQKLPKPMLDQGQEQKDYQAAPNPEQEQERGGRDM